MQLTYRYRIYPNKSQERTMDRWLNTCRILYNGSLSQRKESWEKEKKSVSCYDQINRLVKDKEQNLYLKEVHSQVLQDVLRRLDKSFQNFFRRCKNKENPGYPRFQGRDRYDSFTYPQFHYRVENNRTKLPKIGWVKIKLHRELKGKVKTYTVKRYIDQWHVMLSVELPDKEKIEEIKNAIGIDLGLDKLITMSNGQVVENPRFMKKSACKLKREYQRLSKKKKGSKNRNKQRIQLSKTFRKITNQRRDFYHKVSKKLVDCFDLIVFEDLNIKGMLQSANSNRYLKKGLNRSINDVSWDLLTSFCSYKAEYAGKYVEFVDPKDTSQLCSVCGRKVPKELWDRVHDCPFCKSRMDRDLNSSKVVLGRSKILQDLEKSKPVEIPVESVKQEAYRL